MKLTKIQVLFCLTFLTLFPSACSRDSQKFDLVILNGTVLDGSGQSGFSSDIGISGRRIVRMGSIENPGQAIVIRAEGKIVAPGFIDVHTHCDRGIDRVPTVDNYLLQGVTTVVGGNCGGHPYPLADLFSKLESHGISPNFACLIGHNTIRRLVMEYRMERPTAQETSRMKQLIREEMLAGGLGFSTGLSYLPGRYSDTQELIDLASAVAPFGGLYATHMRDQGEQITEAIEESIRIGEANGITIQISHIKLAKDSVWGQLERITRPVEDARSRGVRVFLDQYPYTATSSGFTSSFPAWAFEGGRAIFLKRLDDPAIRARIKAYIIERRLTSSKGIDKLSTINIAAYEHQPELNGKNLRDILLSRGVKPGIDSAAELIMEIERNGGASGVFFQMAEEDVSAMMRLPYNMHASDGGVQVPGDGVPHPRNYGTFPRVIAHFVREKKVIPLEEAIRKMTSLPAEVFGLRDRGRLMEGAFADITIFDPRDFTDQATFSQPHRYSRGLSYVLVNGTIVVENNRHTGARPGDILYGPGKTNGDDT